MYLCDYHSHSTASPDGHATIAEMTKAAIDAGLSEFCITDHAECAGFFERGDLPPGLVFYKARVDEQFAEAQSLYGDQIRLLYGIEVAQGHEAPCFHKDMVNIPCDFTLGSLHNLRGKPDFYYMKGFASKEECEALLTQYVNELFEIVALGGFDCLAHITYPLRYMKYKYGYDVSMDAFEEEIRTLLKILIEKGIGIELNVSGLRDGGSVTFPEIGLLKLYRSLGGEIITVGSDAHYPRHVGIGIAKGYEMLKEAGFTHVTTFKNRKPSFVKI